MNEESVVTRLERFEEEELVRLAKGGDREALGDLFVMHSTSVRRLLMSVIGTTDDLDDLTQDVFMNVERSLRGFRGDSGFKTWLHRLTVNTAISHLRKLKRRPLPLMEGKEERIAGVFEASAEDRTEAREMIRRLYAILDTISHKRRVAFTLFEIEGKSLKELSETLGVSRATAKSRVWFARREITKKATEDPYLGRLLSEMKR